MQRNALIVAAAAGPADVSAGILQRFGFGPAAAAESVSDAVAALRERHYDLLIVPLQDLDAVDLATLEREIRRTGTTFVIGTAPQADSELIVRAMRSGIHEFIQFPPAPQELSAAIDRLMRRMSIEASRGLTVAVYSAKGGLGTTTVAVNLAFAFGRNNPSARVALADFVVMGGDVGLVLDLRPVYDIGDLAVKTSRIDAELLKSTLTATRGGVWVLPAGDKPETSDVVDASAATTIIGHLSASYNFTVIDCEHHLTDRTLVALDAADRIVLVTQLGIPALRSTQRTIQLCRRLGYPDEKLFVVVNRFQSSDVVSPADAAQVLERELFYKIPNDYRTASAAVTEGKAVTEHDAASALAASYLGLAAKLGGSSPASANGDGKTSGSRIGRLLGIGRK